MGVHNLLDELPNRKGSALGAIQSGPKHIYKFHPQNFYLQGETGPAATLIKVFISIVPSL